MNNDEILTLTITEKGIIATTINNKSFYIDVEDLEYKESEEEE